MEEQPTSGQDAAQTTTTDGAGSTGQQATESAQPAHDQAQGRDVQSEIRSDEQTAESQSTAVPSDSVSSSTPSIAPSSTTPTTTSAAASSDGSGGVNPTSASVTHGGSSDSADTGSKRLHVSNIPFRYRDYDLKAMFEVSGEISEVNFALEKKRERERERERERLRD